MTGSPSQTLCFLQSRTAAWEAGKTKRRSLVCAKSRGRAFLEMETSCVQALSKDYGFFKEFTNETGSSQASKQASKEENGTKNRLDGRLASDRAKS